MEHRAPAPNLVTNPPNKLLDQFMHHATQIVPGKIALLARVACVTGVARWRILRKDAACADLGIRAAAAGYLAQRRGHRRRLQCHGPGLVRLGPRAPRPADHRTDPPMNSPTASKAAGQGELPPDWLEQDAVGFLLRRHRRDRQAGLRRRAGAPVPAAPARQQPL